MTLDEIEANVTATLRELQHLSGRTWSDLTSASKPIGSLEGFDSLASIEATVVLEEKLGCRIEQDSLFISDDGGQALTIRQISERIASELEVSGARTR